MKQATTEKLLDRISELEVELMELKEQAYTEDDLVNIDKTNILNTFKKNK